MSMVAVVRTSCKITAPHNMPLLIAWVTYSSVSGLLRWMFQVHTLKSFRMAVWWPRVVPLLDHHSSHLMMSGNCVETSAFRHFPKLTHRLAVAVDSRPPEVPGDFGRALPARQHPSLLEPVGLRVVKMRL